MNPGEETEAADHWQQAGAAAPASLTLRSPILLPSPHRVLKQKVAPPGTPICIRTVATLLDTLVRSNGDFPLYPFLFTGINSFDRDSLLHPSVCGEWEESISV